MLLVISFGMALWFAEGRDEQQMLSAIGAPPRTLTRMTARRSLILTVAGVVVAVPLGYLTVSVIATNAPFRWLVAGAFLIAIPLIVSAVSYAGSVIGRRVRPPSLDLSD